MKISALLLVWMIAPVLHSQSTPASRREIVANLAGLTVPHTTMPLMTICAGRANEGLRADWQQQLALLQREVGFQYLRFHGLLHDDMGIYSEDIRGNPSYAFEYVDTLYDAMLAAHIRPFVEFSFMPAKLASGTRTVFWWKANVSPPKDMSKWNGLIRALMDHWLARYGLAEVSRWYFEIWNEPDLPGFWSGTEDQYFNLYKHTATTVKDACPLCRVGGPASAIVGLETRWLTFVADQQVPADFLSTHAYGVLKQTFAADGEAITSTGEPIDRIRATRTLLDNSATPHLELHYTEWSSRYTPTHPLHDQYASAAFILEMLRQATGLTQSMAYWTFTDIFEEDGPRLAPFHGGFGLLTLQGIRKPAFFAYKFLAQLGPEDIPTSDKDSWLTRKPDGSLQALFWSYSPAGPTAGQSEEAFYRQERPAADIPPTELKLSGLRNGRYLMRTYVVGHAQNDAYTAYLRMGSPAELTRAQLAALNAVATGDPVSTKSVQVSDTKLDESFPMHENDCLLVTLQPQ